MRVLRTPVLSAEAPPIRPVPPSWVDDLFIGLRAVQVAPGVPLESGTHEVTSRSTPAFTQISARAQLPGDHADALAHAVAAVYRSVAAELHRQARHAVRIWNFVPDIQGPMAGAGDRYMAFNAGRFDAYSDWFGDARASAVRACAEVSWLFSSVSCCSSTRRPLAPIMPCSDL